MRYAETEGGKKIERQHEIDFIVNMGMRRVYIQSAFNIDDPEKRKRELTPLLKSGDFFKKILVTAGNTKAHMDENGIVYMGIIPFLLEGNSLDSL